ncbi:MAG: primosomal protein N', partial [Caldimonas sp.]
WHPAHPLYQALARHDYAAFAESQLKERESAGLPPWSHLAMLRAEARSAEAARDFLRAAGEHAAALHGAEAIAVYPPVPMAIARIANVERMQMLVESNSRAALQRFLAQWLPALHELRRGRKEAEQRILRWAVDVDPLSI